MTMILVIPMTSTTMMHTCKGSSVKHKNVIRMTTTQAQIVMVKNSNHLIGHLTKCCKTLHEIGWVNYKKNIISDEDFVAGSSGSEVAEEYDSEAESSTDTEDRDSDEDEEARKERKRKAREDKLEKKEKKTSSRKVSNTFKIWNNYSRIWRLFGCWLPSYFSAKRRWFFKEK